MSTDFVRSVIRRNEWLERRSPRSGLSGVSRRFLPMVVTESIMFQSQIYSLLLGFFAPLLLF
jgi:hypothetical protein